MTNDAGELVTEHTINSVDYAVHGYGARRQDGTYPRYSVSLDDASEAVNCYIEIKDDFHHEPSRAEIESLVLPPAPRMCRVELYIGRDNQTWHTRNIDVPEGTTTEVENAAVLAMERQLAEEKAHGISFIGIYRLGGVICSTCQGEIEDGDSCSHGDEHEKCCAEDSAVVEEKDRKRGLYGPDA